MTADSGLTVARATSLTSEQGEQASVTVARVMLESPLPQLDRLFDYRVPPLMSAEAVPGVRVKVPLRSAGRIARGYIVEVVENSSYSGNLSDIEEVVSQVPVLSPEVWTLARRVADRSGGGASDVVRLAVPPRQVRVERVWLSQGADHAGEAGSVDEPAGVTSVLAAESEALSPKISGYGDGLVEEALAAGARVALPAIPTVAEVTPGVWVGRWAVTMAEAAFATLARGQTSILAVPDYRDQEQLIAALQALVPHESITPLDARQSNPDRYRNFLACLTDEARIIVGNRSVVYAPSRRLGLIAIWDDADPLHVEPLSPGASTRDVALIRQEQSGSALILLSHSRDTWLQRLVELGYVTEIRQSPTVLPHVVPTVQQGDQDAPAQSARIPSTAFAAVRKALESGPVLVQVARPGYAPVLACASCRAAAKCPSCEGPLKLAHANATPACGWCGAIAASWRCRSCEGQRLRLVSLGTGRTAEELGRAFPGIRVIVSDGERNLLTVSSAPALVVATRGAEPVAAGGYRAVLLLDGERMLARESLTVAEDCLRWWSNAIALAAPRAPAVIVGVGGVLARALVTWQQDRFASEELQGRRALRFPPAVRVASVKGRADIVEQTLATLLDSVTARESATIDVLGPVDADEGLVRAIVRFDYTLGADAARSLRSSVVKNATGRTKTQTSSVTGTKTTYRPPPTLRIRFDDTEFLE
jgi:primosomal protein N' (replication factor Y)